MTVHDLPNWSWLNAPPYLDLRGKTPLNLAGMAAQNVLAGDVVLARWGRGPASSRSRNDAITRRPRSRRASARVHSRSDLFHSMSCASAWVNCRATAKSSRIARAASAPTTCAYSGPTPASVEQPHGNRIAHGEPPSRDEIPGPQFRIKKLRNGDPVIIPNISDRSPLWKSSVFFLRSGGKPLGGNLRSLRL